MNRIALLSVFFLLAISTFSQIGGRGTYEFLNLNNSARSASLGGKNIVIHDNDLNFTYHNPSLLSSEMSNHLVMNYVGYFADIKYGYVSYAKSFGKVGNFATGIHYINYGEFIEANEDGIITGNFKAAEYALNLIWSKPIDSLFTVGANLKPILSNLEEYKSYGLALDLGITYHNPKNLLTAALVFKNIGTQIKPYYEGHYEPLPFEIQLGFSKKLSHAPFRISIIAQQLQKIDLTYNKPEEKKQSSTFSNEYESKNQLEEYADKFMRHLILGVEFIPFKNFYFNFGYNHQRRKEMQIIDKLGFVGFSWGFGLKIKKFHISYGRASYHLAGASNHFSLSVNFSNFYKKRK